MHELMDERGMVCAVIRTIPLDGEAWALAVSWREGSKSLPDSQAWNDAIEASIKVCREEGATVLDSRVVTSEEGVDGVLVAARAALHRDSLIMRGFTRGEGRVEYRMNLEDALLELGKRKVTAELAWSCPDVSRKTELTRVAELLRQASEGDPAAHEEDDALGFLAILLEDEETLQAPERIQIGTVAGTPAAILALKVIPGDGWSTIHYLGVLPAFRGRGFGREAMLQGFRSLKAMGGKTYHDGTGSANAAARALFARLGRPPIRTMEEWRFGA